MHIQYIQPDKHNGHVQVKCKLLRQCSTKQLYTPKTAIISHGKSELPQTGFEPKNKTYCILHTNQTLYQLSHQAESLKVMQRQVISPLMNKAHVTQLSTERWTRIIKPPKTPMTKHIPVLPGWLLVFHGSLKIFPSLSLCIHTLQKLHTNAQIKTI